MFVHAYSNSIARLAGPCESILVLPHQRPRKRPRHSTDLATYVSKASRNVPKLDRNAELGLLKVALFEAKSIGFQVKIIVFK